MNTKVLLMTGILALSTTGLNALAENDDIKIIVNGETIVTDTAPVIENGRTLVPIRAISEALICDVAWITDNTEADSDYIPAQPAVVVFDGIDMVMLWIGEDAAFKTDGVSLTGSYKMDVSPKIINDRTMVPIRCVSELFGAKVDWDETQRAVVIDYQMSDEKKSFEVQEGIAEEYGTIYASALYEMYEEYRDYAFDKKEITKAEIELSDGGIIELELYNSIAPVSVENFVKLAEEKAFDGKIFHRVIEDFMIQGGAFDIDGVQAESEPIVGEFIQNGWFNLIPHTRGAISMARTQDPNSGSNQFFIVHKDSPHLNGAYAAFGMVTKGIEYVDSVAAVETDEDDKPLENIIIKEVRIVK